MLANEVWIFSCNRLESVWRNSKTCNHLWCNNSQVRLLRTIIKALLFRVWFVLYILVDNRSKRANQMDERKKNGVIFRMVSWGLCNAGFATSNISIHVRECLKAIHYWAFNLHTPFTNVPDGFIKEKTRFDSGLLFQISPQNQSLPSILITRLKAHEIK